jgi:Na+-transporting NADH:ubiquinone oxidoreductase subunit A
MIKIKKGLDLPIGGDPVQEIDQAAQVSQVALVGVDFPGFKPTMEVTAGDKVTKGQVVFTDKKNPGVKYTAPASGIVNAVNRGKKRVFESLVIDLEGDDEVTFDIPDLASCDRDAVTQVLIDSGEWTAFKTRPFGKVPAVDSIPDHIFVSAMDTRPLAADPALYIQSQAEAFENGLKTLTKVTEGTVYVCSEPQAEIPGGSVSGVQTENFTGVHPAGLVGTHIHYLAPVSQNKTVWSLGYQDVIAIGSLFATGKLFSERVISIGGPGVNKPRLLKTVTGANLEQLLDGEISAENQRMISGSVLDGRKAQDSLAFLGRFHNQVSVLPEGNNREFFGFIRPGANRFSLTRLFLSSVVGTKGVEMTTSTGGSNRAMVPLGGFEEMMPLDILPTQLLRALLVSDVDAAIELGCLELDEEDLALCTFACTGKYEYGPYLREMLDRIEAEG